MGQILFFLTILRNRVVFEEWENFADFLTMYRLILGARGYDLDNTSAYFRLSIENQADIETYLADIEVGRLDKMLKYEIPNGWIDETISIISLCKLGFPGKGPAYQDGLKSLWEIFRGIYLNESLRSDFVEILSPELKKSANLGELDFSNTNNIFYLYRAR